MAVNSLQLILNKESILKTANARELAQAPQDVLRRYQTYALTHVPLGDSTKQLANLQRVVVENKTCAIGAIVGPYGYGKTSTAVHLWNELREKRILAVPPFLWVNLQQLLDAVYYWIRFEFQQGPAKFIQPLSDLYERYAIQGFERIGDELDPETARAWFAKGLLNLELRPEDVVQFYSEATEICEQAGYRGLAVFTDELQATVAEYKPSRDQFFNDLFQVVKDTLDRPGKWALIISTDDGTEAMISQMRADVLQRMQRSALYFRVKDVYNRRQYPAELWAAFEERFGFDGGDVILPETLEAIGQIAAREDLGAGPRMVTDALALAVKHYERSHDAYQPLHFVNDFLDGLVKFDQRGKFGNAVRRALDNVEVQADETYQNVIKLLAAFPAGCPDETLQRFNLLASYESFPPLARRELIVARSEGHTLRFLLEEERPPELIEQRLTNEFSRRYTPELKYSRMATEGFLSHILLAETFGRDWKPDRASRRTRGDINYQIQPLTGSFDRRYPDRKLTLAVATVPQSPTPDWELLDPEADIELRFELNYQLTPTEPSQLLISPGRPQVAVFQLNLNSVDAEIARNVLFEILFEYYSVERLTPLLSLALMQYMFANSGDLPDDINRIKIVAGPLRQYALTLLLGDKLQVNREEFASAMVGHDRIRELFRTQCRVLYPDYKTLVTGKKWQQDLQQYNYALERVVVDEGVSVARGRRLWDTTKDMAADAFRIPKLSLTRLETLLDTLSELISKEEYSGRGGGSSIQLKFKLHPLEKQWLDQLDESGETVTYNGIEAPAIYAIELLRQTGQQGYTPEEMQQVLMLMQSRQFVAFDQRKGLLIRAIDAVDDLQAAVAELLEQLATDVGELDEAILDFEPERYSIGDYRAQLSAAQARDDLEILKNELRRRRSGLMSYATALAAQRRSSYQEELAKLRQNVQRGTPEWLSRPFSASPLQDLLEQQRVNVAGAYESTLGDMRQLFNVSNAFLQAAPEAPIEAIVVIQKALPDLKKEVTKLQTRLKGYADQKEDLDDWRRVIQKMTGFEAQTGQLTEKYGTDQWQQAVAGLWQTQRDAFVANPLNIPRLHQDLARELDTLQKELAIWLENRREDFEQQRSRYELALADAGMFTRLRIPFDQQNPAVSYSALFETVLQHLSVYLSDLQRQFSLLLQKIRYTSHVQGADLATAEVQAGQGLHGVEQLRAGLSEEKLRDMARAERELLRPLQQILKKEQALAREVKEALEKRRPEGQEVELLATLEKIAANGEVDLYSLIMRQLDQDTEIDDLAELMAGLQGLFQKNQIGIRVRLL